MFLENKADELVLVVRHGVARAHGGKADDMRMAAAYMPISTLPYYYICMYSCMALCHLLVCAFSPILLNGIRYGQIINNNPHHPSGKEEGKRENNKNNINGQLVKKSWQAGWLAWQQQQHEKPGSSHIINRADRRFQAGRLLARERLKKGVGLA